MGFLPALSPSQQVCGPTFQRPHCDCRPPRRVGRLNELKVRLNHKKKHCLEIHHVCEKKTKKQHSWYPLTPRLSHFNTYVHQTQQCRPANFFFFFFLIPSFSTYSSSCHKKPTPTDVTRRSGVKPRRSADSYQRVEQRDETEHVTHAAIFLHRPTGCVLRRERLDRRQVVGGVSPFAPLPCVHACMFIC